MVFKPSYREDAFSFLAWLRVFVCKSVQGCFLFFPSL